MTERFDERVLSLLYNSDRPHWFSEPLWLNAGYAMQRAVSYRLPRELAYDQDLLSTAYDFGRALTEHGAFSIPSDMCWFQWVCQVGPTRDGGRREEPFGILAYNDTTDNASIRFFSFRGFSEGEPGAVSFLVAASYYFDSGQFYTYIGENAPPDAVEVSQALTPHLLIQITTAIGLLNFKGLTVVQPPPISAKVAAARERSGKPPLRRFIMVKVPSPTVIRDTADGERLRSSPRPHYRRGHVRRLGDSIIPVRPSFVMGGDVPREYIIKSS